MECKEKINAKRFHFPALMLLALLMVLPASAFATAGDDQEIGVPQAMNASVKGCFGAVLSPDGNHFYTVREGLLTQYKIKPFKKIGSIALEQEPFKERKYGGRCRVLMTEDKAKLILVEYDRMFLLDANTGQVLNKYERNDLARAFDYATLNNNDLVILDTNRSENAYFHNLTIWDANTLKFKREIHDLGKNFDFFPTQGMQPGMTKVSEKIYLQSAISFAVLSSKTYAPEVAVLYKPGLEPANLGISRDFNKLYIPYGPALKLTDYLSRKQIAYDELIPGSVLVLDQETREFRIDYMNNISREELEPVLIHREQLSRTKEYMMLSGSSGARALLRNINTSMRYIFYQYESGEAILLGADDKYFKIIPNARKYLVMKNSAGKIVPINDATFMKYLRKE